MAKTIGNAEERLKRILEIRDYILDKIEKKESFSTRSIAKYFSENRFNISNATVHTYLNELSKIDNFNYLTIKKHLEENKPKTIENIETRKRIMQATKLLLQNYKIEQIAMILKSTPFTIYRDLTVRLPKIEPNKEVLLAVSNTLNEHSIQNLEHKKENNIKNQK